MSLSTFRRAWPVLFCAGLLHLTAHIAPAQVLVPTDVGTTVNGYQDDFNGAALASGWLVVGANAYGVSGGTLHIATAAGDPNHLLYSVAGYNNSTQEVLARIRVLNFGTADPPRGGISVCVDPAASPAGGIDFHFRDEPNPGQRHVEFLDDLRTWGTEFPFAWQNNIWYWLRLRHEPNASGQGGVNDVFGKIWLADGTQSEPAAWQNVYDYIPTRTARTGYAGIVAGSNGGTSDMEVDYVLIKASGLPSITVAPSAFPLTQTPATVTNQPQSQTATECRPAVFVVGYSGTPPITFQWYRDGVAIPGATNASHTLSNVQLADNGAVFRVVVSNVASNTPYSVTSSNATLLVSADTVAPLLLGAANNGLNQILVAFSEPVTAASANNRFNYSITNSSGSLPVLDATLAANQTNVTLTTTGQVEGVVYTLTVNNVTDQCTGANAVPPNSQVTFLALAYASQDIGSPTPAGSSAAVTGGYNVTGGGRDIGGTSDQFQFNSQPRSGDFDLKVRLDSLGLSDTWAEAGLMARESSVVGSRFASVMATPTISGSYFQSRNTANGATVLSGSFPVNYPNTWLRLQRVGNQFNGYASFDGRSWTQLGSVNMALPESIFFGFAVSSHNTNQTTTAAFRDLSAVTSTVTNPLPLRFEPLGQSSRKTSLVISEIMYNPLDRADGKNLEFVELFNALSTPEDISGWRLDGDADFTFPAGTIIQSGAFLVVAHSPADLETVYGISGVLGPFSNTNSLPNTRGTIRLRNRIGAVFLEAVYDTEAPWPVAADGAGHSLVLACPSYGEGSVEAWAASDSVGGSPGRLDPVTLNPLRNVVINEILAHGDVPLDFVELYNYSTQPADLSGCFLSDDRNTNKFVIPPNTVLPPRGFLVYDELQLGFSLSAAGETVYLVNSNRTRVLDALRFGPHTEDYSWGRYPDGAPHFYALGHGGTPGSTNSFAGLEDTLFLYDVVINEIMYNPISGHSDDEYVELYNRSLAPVNLGGWRFVAGIDYTFPSNTYIPPHGYIVVARNVLQLGARYPGLGTSNLFGNFGGNLANGGERLALARPEELDSGSEALVYIVVNEVTYRNGGRWGRWSDGGGSSLELIDARSDNRLAANWADSDETAKAPWTTVSVTGVTDNGNVAADQLQVLLQGAGECLIDNVDVHTQGGINLIANSTFEANATGWTAEGTQQQSGWESAEGFGSLRSYHVRASDRGDNQVNRIRTPLVSSVGAGVVATISAKVRWLRGHPEILFRLRGNWLEAAVAMDLPINPGTPGARNSRALTNAGPAIHSVSHHPIVPAVNEPVIVTARVHDPDGLASVQVRYRLDPSATLFDVSMSDNGEGADAVAGDGLFSAMIPGQAANVLVAFHVQATDQFSPGATTTFPNDAPTRECLVRFGESVPTGSFPSYRFWMTQASFNAWDSRHNLNNTLNDITFVLGTHRVIYNAGAVYAGSPYIAPGFTTPTGNRCGYSMEFPADDPILGGQALVLDWPGGHGNENTAMQEQMAYWIADQIDIPFSHRYYIRLSINGVTDMQRGGVFEAVLQPGSDFLKQWSPGDTQGDFFKIDRAFEFSDAGGTIADPEPQLLVYTTPDLVKGGTKKKTEKYRWYWLQRSFESANDYTNLFLLADALNAASPQPYTSQTEALVDVEEWMRVFMVEHIINNFDSWGHDIGKNMYMYKPNDGGWQIYMFDLDWLMLVSPGGPGNYSATTGPLFVSDDPTVTRMYSHPPFRRACFRAVQDAVSNAFVVSKYEAVMDAKYNSLVANGITLCDGQALAAPTLVKQWFSQRRGYLLSQLAAVASPFAITGTNSFTVSSNLVTLNGTAPIDVRSLEVNGVPWPITWTSVSNWTLRLPVNQATNLLTVLGYDLRGNRVAGASNRVTVVYSGAVPAAAGTVVLNEIMYNPPVPAAEFVELFNTSPTFAFDLSGWSLNGLDYAFPEGSFISPQSHLLLVKNRAAAIAAYGTNLVVFDVFNGNLQSDGETLTLYRPGSTNSPDLIIDRVRYENAAPWPREANGFGPSLQLIDPAQDNARVSNWSEGSGWRFYSYTGPVAGTRLIVYLENVIGDIYLDDLVLVAGSVAGIGTNLVRNGDFEGPLTTNMGGPWNFFGAVTNSVIDTTVKHSGNGSLHLIQNGLGGGAVNLFEDTLPVTVNATYTLSYWYLPVTNDFKLVTRLGSNFRPANPVRAIVSTPGTTNSVVANLPSYPLLWLNEVQPENVNGILDVNSQLDPWLELYNAGTNDLALDGFFLANNYTNLVQWSFPAGSVIGAGEFKVIFADGHPEQSTPAEWHTSFRLSAASGSLVLTRSSSGAAQVLDYLNYHGIGPGRSYGSYPDGQPFTRHELYYVTPRQPNNGASAPLIVSINEWMASNTRTIGDPAGFPAQFNDWFELYNPGTNTVDLGGYYLTDNLTNKFQYEIPPGYTIPPGGFLLVWADNEPGQNNTNAVDLHVNFQLNKEGEAIGLFAADGTQIDAVTFGIQTNDVSMGRVPDGSPDVYSMATPTPRSANVLPSDNAAPVLGAIGDQTAHKGQTLTFVAMATDADMPEQLLRFSLDAGAPPGASLHPDSGLFSWSTSGVNAPSTNFITVRVTDNGSPPRSDSETIRILVLHPPGFNVVSRSGNQVTLGWSTIPGRSYRVESTVDLGAPDWQPLGGDLLATASSLSVTVDAGAGPHQFFRIVVVP